MAKVTYDLTGVDDLPDDAQAPVGTYRATVESAEFKTSSNNNPMISMRWRLTHSADGTKLKENYAPVFDNPLLEHDSAFVMNKTKALFNALGLKLKGALDPEKQMVGKKAQLKLKSDTDQDGDYRPRIAKVLPLDADDGETPEPEEVEEAEEEAEEEDDEEAVDLDTLDRAALKKLIKDEGLEIKILKSKSDDDLRTEIADALGGGEEDDEEEDDDEEEPEAEADEEEAEDGEDGYDDMSLADLKKEFKERELDAGPLKGKKGSALKTGIIEALREDDSSNPF